MKDSSDLERPQTSTLRVYSHDRGGFSDLRGARVLIYWPHGFGDLVGLGYVLPLLDRSNRYWITRFGDHYTALMENNPFVTPVYVGRVSAPEAPYNGAFDQNGHFGLEYSQLDGSPRCLCLPPSISAICCREKIEVVLWTSYPEVFGREPFPYHSKPRNLIRHLAPAETVCQLNGQPLKNSISFRVCRWVMRWVESRLQNYTGYGRRKLCIISRNGFTSVNKNWGHQWREEFPEATAREGEECREFMRLMIHKDPRWMFLSMEDRLFSGDHTLHAPELNAFSFAEIFGPSGTHELPFAIILKALVNLASLAIGVPTGPYHLCAANSNLPTVGVWIEHLPSWYDEPKSASIHLLGRTVIERLASGPGNFISRAGLYYRTIAAPTRAIPGMLAFAAVEQLLW